MDVDETLQRLEKATGHPPKDTGSKAKPKKKKAPASQATQLVAMASGADLWHSPGGDAYATFRVGDHRETWPIRGKSFRRWVARQYYAKAKKTPGSQAVQDALAVLEGQALFAGKCHDVSVRVAKGPDGAVYLDLANGDWQAIRIDASGWSVVGDPPVRFRRARAMLPLPTPVPGGNVGDLRQFVNVTDQDWPLLLGSVVGSLGPVGPFPVTCFHGEQGSAKSTTARVVRSLIDPNTAPLRAEPRDTRDLAIAGNNGWVVALDNLSGIPAWLSDAICRLSTGGGFATRTLYEDQEETIFNHQRPVILTSISEVASRGDLLDRSLLVSLPTISDDQRLPEAEFWQRFELQRPAILGALLDAVVVALRRLPTTKLDRLPRMADFALWATAAEPSLGLPQGAFLDAYQQNHDATNDVALEASPVAKYLLDVAVGDGFTGTPGDLLAYVEELATDKDKRLQSWPQTPRAMGAAVRRLAPNLRKTGLHVEFGNQGRGRQKRRNVTIRKVPETTVPTVPTVPNPVNTGQSGDGGGANGQSGDANRNRGDAAGTQNLFDVSPDVATAGTVGVDGDAKSGDCSSGDHQWVDRQAAGGRVKVECRRCGKFQGYREDKYVPF